MAKLIKVYRIDELHKEGKERALESIRGIVSESTDIYLTNFIQCKLNDIGYNGKIYFNIDYQRDYISCDGEVTDYDVFFEFIKSKITSNDYEVLKKLYGECDLEIIFSTSNNKNCFVDINTNSDVDLFSVEINVVNIINDFLGDLLQSSYKELNTLDSNDYLIDFSNANDYHFTWEGILV